MDDIFRPMRDFVLVYLDDIHVFSKDEVQHMQHLERVLAVLRQHKFIDGLNCALDFPVVHFARHNCCSWATPSAEMASRWTHKRSQQSRTGGLLLQSQRNVLLGLANYFRYLVVMQGYSTTSNLLHELPKKDKPFQRSPECQKAFEQM